jgi:hypothetical protein
LISTAASPRNRFNLQFLKSWCSYIKSQNNKISNNYSSAY